MNLVMCLIVPDVFCVLRPGQKQTTPQSSNSKNAETVQLVGEIVRRILRKLRSEKVTFWESYALFSSKISALVLTTARSHFGHKLIVTFSKT
jgi:hypothetical protein